MTDPTSFLYPFLHERSAADRSAADRSADPHTDPRAATAAVVGEVEESARRKADDVIALRRAFIEEQEDDLIGAAVAMADRFRDGGRLLAFGCGGSATDALDIVHDFLSPRSAGRPLPALSLVADTAIITAVANDVGFDNVFVRQLISYGRAGDIAVGISTSGNSRSLLDGFRHARRAGLLTVGILGYDGGEAIRSGALDHALVVRSDYIPRVQEAQATICHALRELVEVMLE